MKISIDIVQMPTPLTREQKRELERDTLLDKCEHAYACLKAGRQEERAIQFIRKLWSRLESNSNPIHLEPVKEYLAPIIQEYGSTNLEEQKCQE